MSDLCRRGFLTGLLSTTAMIAAGPIAKVIKTENLIYPIPCSAVQLRLIEDQEFLEGLSQRIATTLWCGNLKVSPMAFTGLRALSGNIANDGVA